MVEFLRQLKSFPKVKRCVDNFLSEMCNWFILQLANNSLSRERLLLDIQGTPSMFCGWF